MRGEDTYLVADLSSSHRAALIHAQERQGFCQQLACSSAAFCHCGPMWLLAGRARPRSAASLWVGFIFFPPFFSTPLSIHPLHCNFSDVQGKEAMQAFPSKAGLQSRPRKPAVPTHPAHAAAQELAGCDSVQLSLQLLTGLPRTISI